MDERPITWHNQGEFDAILMQNPERKGENNFTEEEKQYKQIGNKVEKIKEVFEKAKEVLKPVLRPILVGAMTTAVGVGALAIAHNIPHQEPQQIEENIEEDRSSEEDSNSIGAVGSHHVHFGDNDYNYIVSPDGRVREASVDCNGMHIDFNDPDGIPPENIIGVLNNLVRTQSGIERVAAGDND